MNARGKQAGGVVVLRDITVTKKAEAALKFREEKNRTILATGPMNPSLPSIKIVGSVSGDEQATATFGWTAREAVGRLLTEAIIPERFREEHRAGVERFVSTGEGPLLNKRLEFVALHRDGR